MTRWKRFVKYINKPVTFRLRKKIEVIPTGPVILLINHEDGTINDAFREGDKEKTGFAIRVIDFPLNGNVEEIKSKNIDWKEFPLWRKEQFTVGTVNLDWGQIKGYLI